MSDKLRHDADLFEKAAERTSAVRDRVNSVLSTLDSALTGRGAPWGNDKLGAQFAEGDQGYLVAREKMSANIKTTATNFDNFYSGQTKTAKELRRMDTSNGDGFR
ncbi:hypothetical protein ACQP1G_41685 [Nocardia sp. CA-107356]|uniref:hypothetical protein n=1 Tax=Nocardia sp. CA-107356 TaxID=3239972 RepID=UPI003D930CB8